MGRSRQPGRAPTRATIEPSRRGLYLAMLVVAGIAVVSFSSGMNGRFVMDDGPAILKNETIESVFPLSRSLAGPATGSMAGRPLANLSFAVNHAANRALGLQDDPTRGAYTTVGYHVVNLALHLAVGWLLFVLLRRTIRAQRASERWADRAEWIALGLTAVWLVHPLQTEVVYYLTQRTDLLASLFYLATLSIATGGEPDAAPATRNARHAGALVCIALGVMCKESVATVPLMVLLYDRAFQARSWRALVDRRTGRPGFYAAMFAVAAVTAALLLSRGGRADAVGFGGSMSWYAYLYTQCSMIGRYLRLVVWPTDLTLDYGARLVTDGSGVLPGIVLTALGIATVITWIRARPAMLWFAFTASWFFVMLAPTSSIVPMITEVGAERRMHLPLMAVLVLMAGAADWAWRRVANRRAGPASPVEGAPDRRVVPLVVVVCIALGIGSFQRGHTYGNVERMWRDAVRKRPGNPRAHHQLGTELMTKSPPNPDEAAEHFRMAIAIDSNYASAWFNLGEVALSQNRLADAQADYARALSAEPRHFKALDRLGRLAAMEGYNRSAATDTTPALDAARAGLAYAAIGRRDDALRDLDQALSIAGDDGRVYVLVGRALLWMGMTREAEAPLARALVLAPLDPEALVAMGAVRAEQGDRQTARTLFQRALAVSPGYPPALRGLEALGSGR